MRDDLQKRCLAEKYCFWNDEPVSYESEYCRRKRLGHNYYELVR